MTAAERLLALAGTTGTAAALLLVIGAGATTGAALVDYSGLATGTAAEHLLTDVAAAPLSVSSGGGTFIPQRHLRPVPVEETEALIITGLI